MLGRLTQHLHPDVFYTPLDHIQASGLRFRMTFADSAIDLALVLLQKGVDVLFVEEDGSLLSGQNKVEVQCEAHPRVEWDPIEDEVELRLDQQEEGERGPVHEPWGEHGGIGGAQRFVGREDGEEDGSDGAGVLSVTARPSWDGTYWTHVRMSAMKPNMAFARVLGFAGCIVETECVSECR